MDERINIGAESILYGKQKNDGTHNHIYNRGNDRTPAQKRADEAKKKKQ